MGFSPCPNELEFVYNLDTTPVKALLTGWDVEPGKWEISQAVQASGEEVTPPEASKRTIDFERSKDVVITLDPRVRTVINLKLLAKGVPYWSRPDLGLTAEDIRVEGNRLRVTIHSIGAADAPASRVVLRDREERVLATANVPALKAPADLLPKTAEVVLSLPANADWKGGSITVESAGGLPEITLKNNRVEF